MKTAEEWCDRIERGQWHPHQDCSCECECSGSEWEAKFKSWVHSIQLDAYKAGMHEAAFIACEIDCDVLKIADTIHEAANELKELGTNET